jgi:hypothetical protein
VSRAWAGIDASRNALDVGWIKRRRRGSDIDYFGHVRFGCVGSNSLGFEPNCEGIAEPADVMATQAGHGPLDYSAWDAGKPGYIAAIHAGLAGNYASMRECVGRAWRPEQT